MEKLTIEQMQKIMNNSLNAIGFSCKIPDKHTYIIIDQIDRMIHVTDNYQNAQHYIQGLRDMFYMIEDKKC